MHNFLWICWINENAFLLLFGLRNDKIRVVIRKQPAKKNFGNFLGLVVHKNTKNFLIYYDIQNAKERFNYNQNFFLKRIRKV